MVDNAPRRSNFRLVGGKGTRADRVAPRSVHGGYTGGTDGGGGGGDKELEARVAKLEAQVELLAKDADLRELKAKVETTLPHLATKADVSELKAEMHSMGRQTIMWNVGTIIAAAGIVFAIMRYLG